MCESGAGEDVEHFGGVENLRVSGGYWWMR